MHVEAWGLNHSLYLPYVMHGRPSVAASFSLRPQDSLWDGAHDARLTGDVVDEILGGKVDRADWSGVPDDLGDGVCPRHKLSLPYPSFPLVDCDRCSRTTRPESMSAFPAPGYSLPAMPRVLASVCSQPACGVSGSVTQVLGALVVKSGALRVRADLARGFRAAWAVLGPWCEIYLALGLEQGLLVEIRKDLRPEGRLPHHREADHGKGRGERVDRRAANSLILNGGYSHHLSSHTLSSIGNSSRLGTLRDRL